MKNLNYWPKGLVLFYIMFLLVTLGVVFFTTYHRVDLVSEDYYAQEISFQQQIDRQQRADSLSAPVTWIYNRSEQSLLLNFPKELESHQVRGNLLFFRPSDARQDRLIALHLSAENSQKLSTAHLPPGLWKIKIFWETDQNDYYTEGQLII